jgi:hypothetical protein
MAPSPVDSGIAMEKMPEGIGCDSSLQIACDHRADFR